VIPSHETVGKTVNITAISSYWWIPTLHQISDAAAVALPLIGLVIVIVTNGYRLWRWWHD
jgi:hypothetical protein